MRSTRTAIRPRAGFTLTEMLVVIVIIGILSIIAVGAVMRTSQGARLSNTRNMMSAIDKTLKQHWAYVVAEADKEVGLDDPANPASPFQRMNALFGADVSGGARNRIIWIKMRLMEAFPVSYLEVTNSATNLYPYQTGIIPARLRKYTGTYAKGLNGRIADNKGGLTESSACLLLALSVARGGAVLDADNLGSSYVTDSDSDGIKEIIDGWNTPLTFFRFPSQNPTLQAKKPVKGGAKGNFADPLDPNGVLFRWAASPGKNTFQTNVHVIGFSPPAVPTSASYVVPTVVSSGADGLLGLNAVNMSVTNPKDEPDNVYSFQLGS